MPAKALSGQGMNQAAFNRQPVGTGPYKVESWTAGDRLVLAANDSYWGGKPANRKVVVAFVTDDNVRAQRMRAGEFDAAELAPWEVSCRCHRSLTSLSVGALAGLSAELTFQ